LKDHFINVQTILDTKYPDKILNEKEELDICPKTKLSFFVDEND
jgi:hypothetical protein